MDRVASVVDTYFRANTYATQLQKEIAQLQELKGELIASKDITLRRYKEQDERIQALEAQLKKKEAIEVGLCTHLEAVGIERVKTESILEAKAEELAHTTERIPKLEAKVASVRIEA